MGFIVRVNIDGFQCGAEQRETWPQTVDLVLAMVRRAIVQEVPMTMEVTKEEKGQQKEHPLRQVEVIVTGASEE